MLRTKADVDRHVAEVLRKVKSEREKNLKCYNIAVQYFKVRDYESAKLYVSMYLLAKEDSPLANKLLGQIYEALGQKERALSAYKTSLEYESNQPELVLKICELMCEPDVTLDADRARYWCERGSEFFPHDPAIFRLKERLLLMGGNSNSQAFEQLIQAELTARPSDVNVRIRLLKLYLETNRVKAAYSHAVELESRQTFRNELSWYECFSKVCETYYEQNSKEVNWEFYMHWVSVLDRAARLTLMEGHGAACLTSIADCIQAVFNFDQALYKATKVSASKESKTDVLYKEFLTHMSAELYLHMATLTLKKAKNDHSNWKDASQCVAPLLFLAMAKPIDTEAAWALFLKADLKKCLQIFRDDAFYRVSQAGYVLLGLAKEAGNQFTEKVTLKTASNWRERLFQRIFSTRDHRGAISTSHLVQNPLAEKLSIKLPVHNASLLSISELVPVFEKVHAKSLHYLVWLGIEVLRHSNYRLPPEFHTYSFTTLQVSNSKLGNVSGESLSRLDMDAFLYLTVFCAVATLDEEILNGYHSTDRPLTLPADISNMLCTLEQAKWWGLACGVCTQKFKNNADFVEIRQTLQQGMEVVRIVGNHGLDVQLIVKLARTFSERANQKQTENTVQEALDARANMYWMAAIPLLEKIQRNQVIRSPVKCLFRCPKKELSTAEISSLLEEGRYFVACQLMKEDEHEKAIEAFKLLRSPHASFNQALIYKKLAEAEYDTRPPEDITSEIRSKHIILLTKARDCLYTTKERIRLDKRNPLHSSLAELMEEIESALVRIEPDFVNRREDGVGSDAGVSSVGSTGEVPVPLPLNTSRQNGRISHGMNTSTPQRTHGFGDFRRHTNQPEYVEVGQLLQIQTLVDQNKKILEQMDTLYGVIEQLKIKVDILSEDMKKLKPAGPEDLYIFGEEEDYEEDVLGQYPTNFPTPYQPPAASHYYPPRGVQGTSTLTYGAPPAPPQFYPPRVEPTIAYQPPVPTPLTAPPPISFYNQNALPFSEGQQLPDFLRTPVLPPKQPVPPVNVVITTSDTLPTGPPPVQPPMSVTIPPQHRLGKIPPPVVAHAPPPVVLPVPPPVQTIPPPVQTIPPPVQTIPTPTKPPVHDFQITMPPTANIPSVEKSPALQPEEFDSEDESHVAVERDPYPDFQPIIPLPDEVTVHTGEENEIVLFENRAKLYRHVNKEWKERGVGVLKILKNELTGKTRILMRRDQVLKICANHLLKSDMELSPLKNSNCAFIWIANDFADETVQLEKLCAKFKTPEEALKFRDAFNEAKKSCGTSPIKAKEDSEKEKVENKTVETGKVNFGGFTFSSAPTVKPQEKIDKVEEKKKETQTAPSPFATFSFTSQRSSTASSSISSADKQPKFGGLLRQPLLTALQTTPVTEGAKLQPKSILKEPVLQSETSPKTLPFVFSSHSEKSQQKHVLFQDSDTETTPSKVSESKTPTTESLSSSKISENKSPSLKELLTSTSNTANIIDFAALSKMNDNKPMFTGSTDSKFAGAGTTVFGRPRKSSESEAADDFEPTAEFKPVIPLPELVEVKTGEEGQEVLFEERAKLFRFDSNTKEWKERGLGKMKILKDPATGACRFLMRREQVLKLCCNHRIASNLEMKSHLNSDKAWTWHAQDYADGEMKNELFALRFKNSDQAKAFKMVVDQVLEDLKKMPAQPPKAVSAQTTPVTSPVNVWKCACLFPNSVDDSTCRACKKSKPRPGAVSPKLSEWMRPKPARWECSNCFTINEPKGHECVDCGTPKKTPPKSPQNVPLSEVPLLKPKAGSWNCQDCYLNNEPTANICLACQAKRPDTQEESAKSPLAELFNPKQVHWVCPLCHILNNESTTTCLNCETVKPSVETKPEETVKLLSEIFKPKPGSWECPACLVLNDVNIENCVACQSGKPGNEPKSKKATKPSITDTTAKSKPAEKSLAEMFKPKEGSWECSGCLVRNDADKTACPACNTPKPGHEPAKDEIKSGGFQFSSGAFTFGMPTNDPSKSGFNFDKPANVVTFGTSENTGFGLGKPTENTAFSFGVASNDRKDGGYSFFGISNEKKKEEKQLFNFGIVQAENQSSPFGFTSREEQDKSQNIVTPFSFGFETGSLFKQKQNATAFQFGLEPSMDEKQAGEQFPSKFEFTFSGVKTPRSPKSPGEHGSDSEPDEVEEDDGDHIHFQPVVPLPDKVEVKTGEEDEEVLYCHRAKLYRYTEGEWKERGVGDMKILRNFTSKKIRLLMRREPIMKLCLNHYLTLELNFTPKDNRAWLWTALDYAEEQFKAEQFCLRFKTPEIAVEFKKAIDDAQEELRNRDDTVKTEPSSTTTAATETSSTDVEVVYENDVTPEEREAAMKLQLPPKFYSYRRAAPCPGCIGCEPDDENDVSDNNRTDQSANPPAVMYEVCSQPTPPSSGASVIVISKSTDETKPLSNTTPTNILLGSSTPGSPAEKFVFGASTPTACDDTQLRFTNSASNKTQSLFSGQPTSTTMSLQTSIFGGKKEDNESRTSKSIFGGTPLYTTNSQSSLTRTPVTPSDPTNTQSLFSGKPVTSNETMKTPSLSGGMLVTPSDTSKTRSLFGGETPVLHSENTKHQSLLGEKPITSSETTTAPSLSGGLPVTSGDSTKTQSIFGGEKPVLYSETTKPQSLFAGSPAAGDTTKSQSLFVGAKDTPKIVDGKTDSLVVGTPAAGETPKSIFLSTPTATSNSSPKSQPFFGSSSFTKSDSSNDGSKSIFGGSSVKTDSADETQKAQFSFGSSGNQQFTFGSIESNKSQFTFGAPPKNNETSKSGIFGGASSFSFGGTSLFNSTGSVFGSKADTSFAKLSAGESDQANMFQTTGNKNFSWSNEKAPVFSKTSSNPNKQEGEAESSGDEAELDQTHDPYFEPIVPLPAAIQVRTGEEDEEKEFCHRAKLYRYDNATKEWKERGVGEMKILKHPVNNTFRLLMRREQVHKVVCNHLLTETIKMKKMLTSDTSLTWGAMNLSDESDTPDMELLAVKFKTPELCEQFKEKVDECIRQVVEHKQASGTDSPQVVYSPSKEDSSGATVDEEDVDEEEDDEDDDYEGNDDYYDDEDEMYELLFEKPVTLLTRLEDDSPWANVGSGNLQIKYDNNLLASRIFMRDHDDVLLFDSVISGDSQLTVDGKDCIWIAEEDAQVLARFQTEEAAEEFKLNFYDGINFGEKALI